MDLLQVDDYVFDIDAGWEFDTDPDRAICRWCYIFHLMQDDEGEIIYDNNGPHIVGVAGGYSGGGCFELERFYMIQNHLHPDAVSKFYIEGQGEVIGEVEIDWFKDMDPKIVAIAEAAYAEFFKWHDSDRWNDEDQLELNLELTRDREVKKQGLLTKKSSKKYGTMYYALTDDDIPWTKTIREYLGLTAGRVF